MSQRPRVSLVLHSITGVNAETLAALCTRHPLALPVLHDLGIELVDPDASVDATCATFAVDPAVLVAAIVDAESEAATRWSALAGESAGDDPTDDTAIVAALLDGVMRTFHRPLAHELATVAAAIEAARRSTNHPSWMTLMVELDELQADLSQHIAIEERVVFPRLRERTVAASQMIRGLQLEHGDAIVQLLAIDVCAHRCLANDPDDACARAAIAALRRFERWLCEHIHVESNTLFQRALHAELARR